MKAKDIIEQLQQLDPDVNVQIVWITRMGNKREDFIIQNIRNTPPRIELIEE